MTGRPLAHLLLGLHLTWLVLHSPTFFSIMIPKFEKVCGVFGQHRDHAATVEESKCTRRMSGNQHGGHTGLRKFHREGDCKGTRERSFIHGLHRDHVNVVLCPSAHSTKLGNLAWGLLEAFRNHWLLKTKKFGMVE